MELKQGKTNEFVIMRIPPSCCFGDSLHENDWIHVVSKESYEFKPYTIITVYGLLKVGVEPLTENNQLLPLYSMQSERVIKK